MDYKSKFLISALAFHLMKGFYILLFHHRAPALMLFMAAELIMLMAILNTAILNQKRIYI
ncbi:TPA: hypothetical protein I7709_00870 [Vibrio vulnificus]|nr:hypothetical protein [Vibrio vulnificus]